MAVSVELRNVCNYALRGVNLEVRAGEAIAIIGPTGAGKTTLLNVVAGLAPFEGSLLIDGRTAEKMPCRDRGIGYVSQDPLLFPHMNVQANAGFGLAARGWPRAQADKRVADLLDMAGLSHLARRFPKTLSGGERRRVSLIRALASGPRMLLLDEPLNSLDPTTARYLAMELRRIISSLDVTALLVTHDLQEAEEIADRTAVLCEGRIEQVGSIEEVLFKPVNARVHAFVGGPNILDCREARTIGNGIVEAKCGEMTVTVPHNDCDFDRIAIYPRDVHVFPDAPVGPPINRFNGLVEGIEHVGAATRLKLRSGEVRVVSEMQREAFEAMRLETGDEAFFILKMGGLRVVGQGGMK